MAMMSGRTCVVTGGTSGIGRETAAALAARGATVIIVGRDPERGERAAEEIRRRTPPGRVESVAADLSSLAEVRALGVLLAARCERLDVLVNNAGVIKSRPERTADGYDATFATNHLGPFLLTGLLTDRLVHSAPSRVVTVSSAAHKRVRSIPWDDLTTSPSYPLSKLLNILFTVELARRLTGTGVTANSLHPGFVRSSLGREVTGVPGALLRLILAVRPGPASGAATSVHLASSPDLAAVSGRYFARSRPAEPSTLAADPEAAKRLWALSEKLCFPT